LVRPGPPRTTSRDGSACWRHYPSDALSRRLLLAELAVADFADDGLFVCFRFVGFELQTRNLTIDGVGVRMTQYSPQKVER